MVKPGDEVTYHVRNIDPKPTSIFQLGLNPPAGWEPAGVDGNGDLESGSEVLVDRGGVFVGPSNFRDSNAQWAEHGIAPNPGYRGFGTNGWSYVHNDGKEQLAITYTVPADAAPGDYSAQVGVVKYATEKSRSLNNVPELTVRVAAEDLPAATAEQTIELAPHRTDVQLGDDLALTATVKDADGNPVADETVTFTLGTKTHQATTDAEGKAVWALTTTEGGTLTATATTAAAKTTTQVTIAAKAAADAVATTVELSGPATAATGSTAKYAAVVFDQEGVLMPNQSVTFSHNGTASQITTDDQGKAVLVVENLTAGTHTVVATVGEAASKTITTEVSDQATDALVETLELDSPAATKAGQDLTYTVTAKDAQGNPLPNKVISATYNGESKDITTGENGSATVSFPAAIGGGDVVFTAEGIAASDTPVVQPADSSDTEDDTPGDNTDNPGADTPDSDSGSTGTGWWGKIGIAIASIFGTLALGGIVGLIWPLIASLFNLPGSSCLRSSACASSNSR